MDRLSGLDASFLYLETPAQLLHVCGLIVLDPSTMPDGYSFDAMRDEIERRVHDVPSSPASCARCRWGSTTRSGSTTSTSTSTGTCTGWRCRSPAGTHELAELSGHLAGQPLDRSRPLWEMWVIEGYDDGKVAVFTKMHHATVDGVSGANLISHLCSLEPTRRRWRGAATASSAATRASSSCSAAASSPTWPGRWRRPSWSRPPPSCSPRPSAGPARARRWRRRSPRRAPRSTAPSPATARSRVADMSLDDIKAIKTASGTTVNDVVLAVSGGALRSYLEARGELPSSSLLATVPVSVRDGVEASEGANKVSALFAKLGTDIEDPLERLEEHGRGQPATPRSTTRRSAPTRSRTGRSSPRRARSASPCGRTPASGWPSGTRSCTTWSSPTCPGRRCRCTSWAPGSTRSTRSARSSTAPASTSP